jgi:phosphoglycolate phosphatase-like HAD superfamily hydrolase
MNKVKCIICDGGGTIWYSMPVLYEHMQAAFSYFGLLRRKDFKIRFPFDATTAINSLRPFNSRKTTPIPLLTMYFNNVSPKDVINCRVKGYEDINPLDCLNDLMLKAWEKVPKTSFDTLADQMGDFLNKALYNYNDADYPAYENAIEGLQTLQKSGYELVMISNRWKVSTEAILRHLGALQYFKIIEAPLDKGKEPKKNRSIVF